jgi:hypothetical protein
MVGPRRSPLVLRVIIKISQVEGIDRAKAIVDDCLASAGVTDVRQPEAMLRFAEALIRKGGFSAVVGRSMKIEALLRDGH